MMVQNIFSINNSNCLNLYCKQAAFYQLPSPGLFKVKPVAEVHFWRRGKFHLKQEIRINTKA